MHKITEPHVAITDVMTPISETPLWLTIVLCVIAVSLVALLLLKLYKCGKRRAVLRAREPGFVPSVHSESDEDEDYEEATRALNALRRRKDDFKMH